MSTTASQVGTSRPPGLPRDVAAEAAKILERWPSAGLAVGVIRDGALAAFLGHGVADTATGTPITADTAFRVGSITKTFTAVAVLQLAEQGLVDLDAPAHDHLRTFALVAPATFRPATIRHLLTHTAGIGYLRRMSDLLHPGVGSGDRAGRAVPPLADYYRDGLPIEVEPGTKWAYSNHGFAVLGQIIEDVSGQPYDQYLDAHVFAPLGMTSTIVRWRGDDPTRRATGYVLRSRGLRAVTDRPVVTAAAGEASSTTHDLARFVAALLRGGAGEHGSVLTPESVATAFAPQFQPDPRLPGMGLAFWRGDEDGHRTIGHTGVVPGFLSAITLAPDDGVGVVALSNTGGLDNRGAAEPVASAVLRRLLALSADPVRTDVPPRPDRWSRLCGWYSPEPGPVTNLFLRALVGAGAEVAVRDRHLVMRPLTPVPSLRQGLWLHADDPDDPEVFRVDMAGTGWPSFRVVFSGTDGGDGPTRMWWDLMPLRRRPAVRDPRPWLKGGLALGAAAFAARARR